MTRYGKTHRSYVNTSARVRGVCVESILVACTIRLHQCSNGCTTRTSECPNRCSTIRTEPPLTLSVGSNVKAYGCEVTKGHFPYEYMDRLERLDDTALPPKEAFFSRLKNEGISDEDYASCQEAWRDNDMTTLRDFLVWNNNRDVVPFLQAINRQFAFYQQRGIDMFKQGISVPGLTLLHLFNDLLEKTYFTIFNEKNKDLHDLVKDNVVGGTSERVRRDRSTMSVDHVGRCESSVLVVAHARHAFGMVHATTGRERLPARIGTAVRTDGCRMVDVGIRTHGTSHTISDQRAREENMET